MTGRLDILRFAVALALIGYSANFQAQNTHPSYVSVTLCEIAFHHERTNPKHVSVDAEFVNAFPHGLALIDRRCERKGLQIDFAHTDLDPSVAFIERHMFEIHRANGKFRGTLKRDRVTGRLYLWLESVLDFQPAEPLLEEYKDEPIYLPDPPVPKLPPA